MANTQYTVLEDFDVTKDYTTYIRPQFCKILQSLIRGQTTIQIDFINNNLGKFGQTQTKEITADVVYKAFSLGCKIGLLHKSKKSREHTGRSFEEFIKAESVSYWMGQLR